MKTILFFNNGGKTHTCETPEIAEAVITDLVSRGCNVAHRLDCDSAIHIDFGGAILVGNPYQRPLPNVTFFDQHYSLVRAYVLRAKQSGDRGGYYKIHAERAICLTPVTFQNLLDYLEDNAERLLLGEVAQNERFFERVADLKQNSPHIS